MIRLDVTRTISSIQKAQAENLRRFADLRPGGSLGRLILSIATRLFRRSVADTHVDTGALRAAHRLSYEEGARILASVYIDPNAVNPRSHQLPALYGIYESARGGTHAFYDRAISEEGGRSGIVAQVSHGLDSILHGSP